MSKWTATIKTATSTTSPCTIGMSTAWIESINREPIPGSENDIVFLQFLLHRRPRHLDDQGQRREGHRDGGQRQVLNLVHKVSAGTKGREPGQRDAKYIE